MKCVKASFIFYMKGAEVFMGKDLRGKEIGEGVRQRPDGKYIARFRSKSGKRPEKVFEKLSEAKKWLVEQKYKEEVENVVSTNMTVDQWWHHWLESFKMAQLKPSSLYNYKMYYERFIKAYLGEIRLSNVKPIHCQMVLNKMSDNGNSNETISKVRSNMFSFFKSAEENNLISKNPITSSVNSEGVEKKEKNILEREEQQRLLKELKKCFHYNVFAFVLQTGLRVGEVAGLKWEDIDFKNKVLYVRRNVLYIGKPKKHIIGTPKTAKSIRTIPLTQTAIDILHNQKRVQNEREKNKPIKMETYGYVFKTSEGNFLVDSNLNDCLYRYCKKANVKQVSMHCLRHTFATRCIEAGMRPKTLQKILGHSNISMTMNLYVHVSEEAIINEMKKFELYA